MIVAATKPESTDKVDKVSVREVPDKVRAEGRDALTAPEGKHICDAYGIPTPGEGLATTAHEATWLAEEIVGSLECKIVSPDILHKTETGGVIISVVGAPVVASLAGDTEVEKACEYLFDHRVVAYPYTTERPVAVLGAKYRWARAAELLDS